MDDQFWGKVADKLAVFWINLFPFPPWSYDSSLPIRENSNGEGGIIAYVHAYVCVFLWKVVRKYLERGNSTEIKAGLD